MLRKKLFDQAWKTAVGPSAISSFTPKDLTPTQKMILARARIWGHIIGGNVSTGHRSAKQGFKGEGMIKYFDGGFPEFVFPYELEDDEDDEQNDEIDVFRDIRNSRKGKVLVQPPKRPLHKIDRYKAKRYLLVEKFRKDQESKLNLTKKQMKNLNH